MNNIVAQVTNDSLPGNQTLPSSINDLEKLASFEFFFTPIP